MRVSVMQVRIVPVSVHELFMYVRMDMRFASIPGERMQVSVMRVVNVRVSVFLSVMSVHVLVMLGNVQPHTDRHEGSRDDELRAHRVALQRDGGCSPEEWRDREIGASSRAAEIAQCENEQDEAHPITR